MVKRIVSVLGGDIRFQLSKINDLWKDIPYEGKFALGQAKEISRITTIFFDEIRIFLPRTVAPQCSPHELWSQGVGISLPNLRKIYLFLFPLFSLRIQVCFFWYSLFLTIFLKPPPPHHLDTCLPCVWPPWLFKQHGLFSPSLPHSLLYWSIG